MARNIDDYTKKYESSMFEKKYQVKYRRKKALELLEQFKHEVIVEIGCGMEPLFWYVDDFEKWIVVEPSKEFCDNAKKLAKDRGNKEIVCIEDFFENATEQITKEIGERDGIDYIVCSSLLHEVENPNLLVQAVKRICNKDTVVNINVPNAKSIHRILAYEMGIIEDCYKKSERNISLQQHNVFDMETLIQCVSANGFEIIEKGSYFPKFLTHKQMELCMETGVFREEFLDGLYRFGNYVPEFGSEIFVQMKLQ